MSSSFPMLVPGRLGAAELVFVFNRDGMVHPSCLVAGPFSAAAYERVERLVDRGVMLVLHWCSRVERLLDRGSL